MAFTISYIYQAIDKFSPISKRVGKGLKGVNKKLRETARGAKKAGGQIDNLAGRMKGLIAGFIGFQSIRKFIGVGADFQDALADLSAITGAAGKDLQFLSEEAINLGKAAATMPAQVVTAFKAVASAKSELLKDPKGLSAITEQILLLANATGLELLPVANVVLDALNQFGAGAESAARFVNVLAAGSKIGASEVAETGVAVVKSGVAAKLAGVSFEELNSLIQVLAKNGVKAEVAGTGLKTALLALETAGIRKIQPSIVGISKALENLKDANLDAARLQKLFGLEALQVGGILIENAALTKEWTAAITGTNIAQEQARIRMATFRTQLRRIGATISGAVAKAFIRLEPVLTRQAKLFTDFLSGLQPGQIDAFADSVAGLVEVFSALATVIKLPASILKGVGTAIGELAGQVATGDFTQGTSIRDAFSVGGKLFGLFGGESPGAANLGGDSSSVDINMNIRDQSGAVSGVESKVKGSANFNVGRNMASPR